MNPVWLVILSVLLQAGASIFETDLAPGEGPHEFVAAANQLRLHESPSAASRIVKTAKVSVGQNLPYDDARYRTTQAGRIRVLAASHVEGRLIGPVHHLSNEDYYSDKFPEVKIEVKPGMTFEYLQYRAEGSCFVRMGSDVVNGGCPIFDESAYKLEAEPTTELWLHVSVSRSSGWLLVTEATVKEVPQ